ncbi:hypothetical protein DID88_000298 [Monilinia fructigena]|uniref:Uncharacterized protein n=1 Tax=Monilinia fructigena TaxID=38457 RepID=A0A395IH46_9HELO|nr:hypothetical protein DID88_000298 [Monilinia fructigena]
MSPPSNSNAVASLDVVTKQKSSPKKTFASDDSKRFRAFLARSDGALPFFMSPTGTHQQFFSSGLSDRHRPSNIFRGSNNYRAANTSHALLHSHSLLAMLLLQEDQLTAPEV